MHGVCIFDANGLLSEDSFTQVRIIWATKIYLYPFSTKALQCLYLIYKREPILFTYLYMPWSFPEKTDDLQT